MMAEAETSHKHDEAPALAPQSRAAQRRYSLLENRMLLHVTLVALGAAIGANLRYGISLWAASRFGAAFPYGTLLINVAGSFAIGVILALSATRLPLSGPLRLLLVTGLLGGFTTFSSFSYEAYALVTSGNWMLALLYLAGSVGLGFVGVVLAFGLVGLLG
jgi:CrcB protein